MSDPTCPKCGTTMSPGFTTSGPLQVRWVPGQPHSWIPGREVGMAQTTSGLKVISYRCPSCGLLLSYAPSPSESA
jgi:hypothetical protein